MAVLSGQPETLARYMLRVIERIWAYEKRTGHLFVQEGGKKKVHKTKIDSDMIKKLIQMFTHHAAFGISTQKCLERKIEKFNRRNRSIEEKRNSML